MMSDIQKEITPMETEAASHKYHGRWVGVVMGWVLPGSAHFFSGHKIQGICLLLSYGIICLLTLILASVPGTVFGYITAVFVVFAVVFFFTILISSYRQVQRLGCFGWILFFASIILFNKFVVYQSVLPFKTYCVEAFVINGMSMSPTLVAPSQTPPSVQIPDRIIVNKWIYRINEPQRGDVVVFDSGMKNENGEPIFFVKRIVGLPGETLDIQEPFAIIDGNQLTEPAVFEKIASKKDGFNGYMHAAEDSGSVIKLPIKLGPTEYFLLGDYSTRSLDSRFTGPVSRDAIKGKAVRIYFPFSRIGLVR